MMILNTKNPLAGGFLSDSGHNPRVKELCAYVHAKVEVLCDGRSVRSKEVANGRSEVKAKSSRF
jgi:hypothetical protein